MCNHVLKEDSPLSLTTWGDVDGTTLTFLNNLLQETLSLLYKLHFLKCL